MQRTSAAMQQVALQGDRLRLAKRRSRPPGRPSSREVYFFLSKDSIATTNDPNAIIRLNASYTVMASPPCPEMSRPPLRADFLLHPYCTIYESRIAKSERLPRKRYPHLTDDEISCMMAVSSFDASAICFAPAAKRAIIRTPTAGSRRLPIRARPDLGNTPHSRPRTCHGRERESRRPRASPAP